MSWLLYGGEALLLELSPGVRVGNVRDALTELAFPLRFASCAFWL